MLKAKELLPILQQNKQKKVKNQLQNVERDLKATSSMPISFNQVLFEETIKELIDSGYTVRIEPSLVKAGKQITVIDIKEV